MCTLQFFITLFALIFTCQETDSIFNKCCSLDHHLDYGSDDILTCLTNGNETEYRFEFPTFLIRNNMNTTEETLDFTNVTSGLPNCTRSSMDIMYSNEEDSDLNETEYEFEFDGKTLMLKVLKPDSLHDLEVEHAVLFPKETYCLDQLPGGDAVVMLCPCKVIPCVRKCCLHAQAYNESNKECSDVTADTSLILGDWVPNIHKHEKETVKYYRLTNKKPDCSGQLIYLAKDALTNNSETKLFLLKNGSLQSQDEKRVFPVDEYCSEYTTDSNQIVSYCFHPDKVTDFFYILFGVMFLIGAVALFMTVILTLVFKEMRKNMHNKMALAHNTMLLIGYSTTGIGQLLQGTLHMHTCQINSFIIQFSMLAAYFWLNAMCIDITWVFSGFKIIKDNIQTSRELIYYSLYAWGSTCLITITMVVAEFSTSFKASLKPDFGVKRCFFNNDAAQWMFLYGPMCVLLTINLILFFYVATKIILVKRQTAMLNTQDSSTNGTNNKNHVMYLKLFLLMGSTYLTEVISWVIGSGNRLWLITDIINLLRSIAIFVIFCCTREVYDLVRKALQKGGEHMGNKFKMAYTNRTYTVNKDGFTKEDVDIIEGCGFFKKRLSNFDDEKRLIFEANKKNEDQIQPPIV